MTNTLKQFAADCRAALDKDSAQAGREEIRRLVEKACVDAEFVQSYLGPDNTTERKILYEDSQYKFCILAHVYAGEKSSNPYEHGPSWAIYGQVAGVMTMIDWVKIEEPRGDQPGKVKPGNVYELTPGVARLYNEGDLHSPHRASSTRLIRIEGQEYERR